jgi:hypothetical protein
MTTLKVDNMTLCLYKKIIVIYEEILIQNNMLHTFLLSIYILHNPIIDTKNDSFELLSIYCNQLEMDRHFEVKKYLHDQLQIQIGTISIILPNNAHDFGSINLTETYT